MECIPRVLCDEEDENPGEGSTGPTVLADREQCSLPLCILIEWMHVVVLLSDS